MDNRFKFHTTKSNIGKFPEPLLVALPCGVTDSDIDVVIRLECTQGTIHHVKVITTTQCANNGFVDVKRTRSSTKPLFSCLRLCIFPLKFQPSLSLLFLH